MWCCSKSAQLLFDTVLGFGGTETVSVNSGDNNPGTSSSSDSAKRRPDIIIDSGYVGSEVVIIKNGLRLCGTGGALGSAPLVQTKSYFEVKVQQEGKWAVGVATRNSPLDVGPVGSDQYSWMLRHTGELYFNALSIGKLDPIPEEGDVVGISFDHIELSFFINGKKGNITFTNVRGPIFPAVYVDEGAVLDVIFDSFLHPPPSGFDKIMKEKSIL
ncbi:unnamed protein product [Orchesella dallaii]|uniref:SPRY domain-containing protein 7 n=1 Tax=Orchesella dallaii TaxID=48710 RepID=A0ABP1RGD1_9HEXA